MLQIFLFKSNNFGHEFSDKFATYFPKKGQRGAAVWSYSENSSKMGRTDFPFNLETFPCKVGKAASCPQQVKLWWRYWHCYYRLGKRFYSSHLVIPDICHRCHRPRLKKIFMQRNVRLTTKFVDFSFVLRCSVKEDFIQGLGKTQPKAADFPVLAKYFKSMLLWNLFIWNLLLKLDFWKWINQWGFNLMPGEIGRLGESLWELVTGYIILGRRKTF